MIAYVLLNGKYPFEGNDEVTEKKIHENKPDYSLLEEFPEEILNFVKTLLTSDPTQRPSAEEALKLTWMKERKNTKKVKKESVNKVVANLTTFKANEIFKQAALNFISGQMVGKEVKADLSKVFKEFDTNNDGFVDKAELKAGFLSAGKVVCDEELDEIFAQIDVDGTGYIAYSEFILASINLSATLTEQ